MAYNRSERLICSQERFRIFDPGAYQYPYTPLIQPSKVPFLFKAPRKTASNKIWTHTVHFPLKQENIPNCTSLKSNVPRFSYELTKHKTTEEVICDCGYDTDACQCTEKTKEEDEEKELDNCQGNIRRRLFTGPANEYSIERVTKPPIDVPFYDTRIEELTAFYQGCKWSRWTSKTETKPPEQRPGPADYTLVQPPDMSKICAEKVRANRRKTSQQLRFIEIVQRRTLRDNQPGPASYSPIYFKRKDFYYPACCCKKQKQTPETKISESPGPADYNISRDFDVKTIGHIKCHAKLPDPAPFGIKDARFKRKIKIGPSPASYCTNNLDLCPRRHMKQCNYAPFGSSASRFKETFVDDDLSEENDDPSSGEQTKCNPKVNQPTWEFRSKTIRTKPPKYTYTGTYQNPTEYYNPRPKKLQYLSPFHSSDGRFRNWYNWIPVYGSVRTPDPARYCTEKPKCRLVVFSGTFSRQRRFMPYGSEAPPPNQFVLNGIEDILHTHNFKLKKNVNKRCKRRCCTLQRPLTM